MLPVKDFTDFIGQNKLFGRDSKVLAAVSGGMDSVLMAHLLRSAGFNFGIAHCNFSLRGDESLADQEFCHHLAEQFRLQFHTVSFDTLSYASGKKISVQMAARELRYQWFEQVRQQHGYDVIALAHHQNDAIETILLNLTRGTGIAGLHGILPKNGHLVRPLLFLKREEIQNLVVQNKLKFVEDSSNASVKYARNKLRHEVIPRLKELNPNLENTFENNLRHFRDMETLLETRLDELKKKLFIYSGNEIHLLKHEVKKLEPKRMLLFQLLQEFGFHEGVVDDLIASLDKQPGKIFESPGFTLLLDREKLILAGRGTQHPAAIFINQTARVVNYGRYKLNILHDDSPLIIKDNPMAASVDAGLLMYPLTLRPWQQSDHFYPLGMKKRKKLSDFFIQEKIPLHEKGDVPLLVNGNGDMVWVGGYRPDERYKVSDNTKKVTIFELTKLV